MTATTESEGDADEAPAWPATVHDILTAWQAGRISARRAADLCGLSGLDELYAAARSSGVPIRKTLLPEEKKAADLATAAIRRRLALGGPHTIRPIAACAAASLAIGTRKGEQET